MKKSCRKKKVAKRVLRLPGLDYAKRAVLNTLGSPQPKRTYEFAIDDFVSWYCSEPRLAFNKTVVSPYRLELDGRRLSPVTINLRLAAVRRLAYEAADTEQSQTLLPTPDAQCLKGRRDCAILAVMRPAVCGATRLPTSPSNTYSKGRNLVIADLIGTAAHVRTVAVPGSAVSCNKSTFCWRTSRWRRPSDIWAANSDCEAP